VASLLATLLAAASVGNTGPLQWSHAKPSGLPFARSHRFSGMTFTGPWASYTTADTFFPSWGADGRLYSPFMDGTCNGVRAFGAEGPYTELGAAVISGSDPRRLTLRCSSRVDTHPGWDGRYASASLVRGRAWYYGSYLLDRAPATGAPECGNYCRMGPFVGFDVSTDGGASWRRTRHTAADPLFRALGALHAVDLGRDGGSRRDAYLVGHGGPRANWLAGDDLYLVRFRPSPGTVDDRRSYVVRRLLHAPGHLGSASITYDAPLRTYLLWVTTPEHRPDTSGPLDTMLLESRHLRGPWRLVQYLRGFGPQAYFATTPSRFISRDGRTLWLSYSANYQPGSPPGDPPGSAYAWVLRELRLNR
jgi:hypothetical protein